MSSQWYTKKPDREKQGPFSDGELKQQALNGTLLQSDLIWREGMPTAVPAGSFQGLFATPNLNSLLDNLVPLTQTATGYTSNASTPSSYTPRAAAVEEEEEDVFSWYRPGDSRAPIIVNWIGFWQFVHSLGSKNKAIYFLLPIAVAIPLGALLGFLTSYIPLVFVNWILVFAASFAVGEAIFQGFRLAGHENKMVSTVYGGGVGTIIIYFFLAGGLYTDYNRYRDKTDPPLGVLEAMNPVMQKRYIRLKAESMVVSKYTSDLKNGKAVPVMNYLFILAEFGAILLGACCGANGGRQDLPNQTGSNTEPKESEDEKIAKMLGVGRF